MHCNDFNLEFWVQHEWKNKVNAPRSHDREQARLTYAPFYFLQLNWWWQDTTANKQQWQLEQVREIIMKYT